MSEYQFVHFLALDRPLDDKAMAFMRKQSSRAEISKWGFTNHYEFGDFRGDAQEMLRRGFDVHLHYANFGTRRLMIRFAGGIPCDKRVLKKYLIKHNVEWHADKTGTGGIVEILPEADADSYDEELYEVEELLDDIAPIRDLLIEGDLRPLYLAWLACDHEDDALEPPVPAGLGTLPNSLIAMAEFYSLSDDLLEAAAARSPSLPKTSDGGERIKNWVAGQSLADLRRLVPRLLGDDATSVRMETLAAIRSEAGTMEWPTVEPTRTFGQLREAAEQRRLKRTKKTRRST